MRMLRVWGADVFAMTTLRDTDAVAEFMLAFGQPVRTTPTADIPDHERLLRVRLVIEEALELAEALGCVVSAPEDSNGVLTPKGVVVTIDPDAEVNLVEAADAIADITVVNKGTGHTLGLPQDAIFEAVHVTNMAKMAVNNVVERDLKTGKVLKPEGWVPPTAAIEALLAAHTNPA